MRTLQFAGLLSILVGLLILFFLRGPLYSFIVAVLSLLGIFVGFLLIIVGIALVVGGGWVRRRRYL